jgi:hypothetical protein
MSVRNDWGGRSAMTMRGDAAFGQCCTVRKVAASGWKKSCAATAAKATEVDFFCHLDNGIARFRLQDHIITQQFLDVAAALPSSAKFCWVLVTHECSI